MKKVIYYCPPEECPTCGKVFSDVNRLLTPLPQAMWIKVKIRQVECLSAGLIGFTLGKLGDFNIGKGWSTTILDMTATILLLVFISGCGLLVGWYTWKLICHFAAAILETLSLRVRDPRSG
jgi:hypothetical protein